MSSTGSPPPHHTEASLFTESHDRPAPMAVTPHHRASRVAIEIIEAGGSAVDAAIAANAVLGVVLPDTCGVGGDLFALVHAPGMPAPDALNASGRAGSGAAASDVRSLGADEVPLRSPWSITVPGCVDGWEALHARFGRLSLGDVLGPAITLAREGFEVSSELSNSLHRIHPLIGSQGSAPPLYPDGRAPEPGDVLTRPHLAETLELIAAAGRESFYGGRVGSGIVAATEGMVTPADLEHRQAEWIEPIGVDVFGVTGWTIPPNSQGYLTLAAARVFEAIEPPQDPDDPAAHHAAVEAYRSVAWERDDVVSDPASAPWPREDLLDEARLLRRASEVDPGRAGRWPAPAPAPGGTAYLCVLDADEVGVSLIQSNFHGIGSGRSAGDTGVFLHNRGAGFTTAPGHPNELLPGRRPLHTLSPTLWTEAGRLTMLLGTRGGHYQPQLLVQLAALVRWHGLPGDQAQARPRWQVEDWGPGASSILRVEATMSEAVLNGLRSRGHEVQVADPWQSGWGPISVISRRDEDWTGAADPRVSTAAAL